jgi:hypothetical protein
MLALLSLFGGSTIAADVWGPEANGPHLWGAHVWTQTPTSSPTGVRNVWGPNVWGSHVWGSHVWTSVTTVSTLGVGKYKAEHDSALADIIFAGASPITFARWTPTTTAAIAGAAMQVKGDPERYAAKGLVLQNTLTLLFCPTLYGYHAYTPEFILPGDVVQWNGVNLTAKDVETVAPDGVVIIARIVVG